jgi:hypothetical protein
MRYSVFALLVGVLAACSPNAEDNKVVKKELSIAERNAIYRRVGRTINHGKCYEKDIDISPIIKLTADTISKGEAFLGKAYFPTSYFSRLAKCYNFAYKAKLSVSTMLMPIEAQGQPYDTVYFKIRPDSLSRVKQGKVFDEYELRARLRASFSDGISGYDTTGAATTVKVFVSKH